jgi:hypothetical protein
MVCPTTLSISSSLTCFTRSLSLAPVNSGGGGASGCVHFFAHLYYPTKIGDGTSPPKSYPLASKKLRVIFHKLQISCFIKYLLKFFYKRSFLSRCLGQ